MNFGKGLRVGLGNLGHQGASLLHACFIRNFAKARNGKDLLSCLVSCQVDIMDCFWFGDVELRVSSAAQRAVLT